jgi:nitroreductase
MKDESFYTFLARRRSASILHDPAPSREEQELILNVAASVPDHGRLMPYRFVVFEGEGRERLGEGLVNAARENRKDPVDESLAHKIKAKAYAAPLQVLIVYSPVVSEKVPAWEQMSAASCTGYALVLAANALGYGAVWKSFAYDTGSELRSLIRLQKDERVLGWVNIGTEQVRALVGSRSLDKDRHVLFIAD